MRLRHITLLVLTFTLAWSALGASDSQPGSATVPAATPAATAEASGSLPADANAREAAAAGAAIEPAASASAPVGSASAPAGNVYHAAAVNPLMGAILPKEAEWRPLTGEERWRLYLKQTYGNPGAYFRALGSAVGDHSRNRPESWGQGFGPYMQRAGARFLLFSAQDSIEAAGHAALGWEPRYIRCKCEGALQRMGHAMAWNFVTYNREGKLRPNLPRIVGAYGAAALPALWRDDYKFTAEGVRSGNQQFYFGGFFNLLREFSPELKRVFRRDKKDASDTVR